MSLIKQDLVSSGKYNIKCPYTMQPVGISIHNTYNDAPARNEINYMKSNNNEVSFHIAVDDVEAIQGLPLDRNSWSCGDGSGSGNRKHISIEICYSKSGGARFEQAEIRASQVVAELLRRYNWGVDKIKAHRDFSNKNCPHRTDMTRFKQLVQQELDKSNNYWIVTGGMGKEQAELNLKNLQALTGWYAHIEPKEDGFYRLAIGGFIGESLVTNKLNALKELTGWYMTYELR